MFKVRVSGGQKFELLVSKAGIGCFTKRHHTAPNMFFRFVCCGFGVSGGLESTQKVHMSRLGRVSHYLVTGNVRKPTKTVFPISIVLFRLPRVPLPWGPLGSQGSLPMGSLWAPKGFSPMGSLGFSRVPSHGIPWAP